MVKAANMAVGPKRNVLRAITVAVAGVAWIGIARALLPGLGSNVEALASVLVCGVAAYFFELIVPTGYDT